MGLILANVLGKKGVIALFGMFFFWASSVSSERIFQFIENKTFGTRDFVLDKAEFLFYKIDPQKLTIGLLIFALGGALLIFSMFTWMGSIVAGIIFGIIFIFIAFQLPKPVMKFLVNRRKNIFQSQMVDGLNLMSSGLRAGLSLPQSFGMVVDELPNPIAQEFNLVLQQNRLGVGLDEALEGMNERMQLDDVQMFVTSINILRETGGNLSETFDTISEIIRERVRLQQKISVYVAQGLNQGRILSAMPFVMMVILGFSNPVGLKKLLTTPIGWILMALVVGLVSIYFFIVKKIITIKA